MIVCIIMISIIIINISAINNNNHNNNNHNNNNKTGINVSLNEFLSGNRAHQYDSISVSLNTC